MTCFLEKHRESVELPVNKIEIDYMPIMGMHLRIIDKDGYGHDYAIVDIVYVVQQGPNHTVSEYCTMRLRKWAS